MFNVISGNKSNLFVSKAITHYSLLTTHYSLLTTHYSLLTTHYSLLTTHYSLLTTQTHYSTVISSAKMYDGLPLLSCQSGRGPYCLAMILM
ncbi:MAG: hypothetical protein EOO38_21365 [Cytophagaceae bacterium]|nr:MAG: hypothetical protein EOO38_21365 [Cytophagaceae bacterium]